MKAWPNQDLKNITVPALPFLIKFDDDKKVGLNKLKITVLVYKYRVTNV